MHQNVARRKVERYPQRMRLTLLYPRLQRSRVRVIRLFVKEDCTVGTKLYDFCVVSCTCIFNLASIWASRREDDSSSERLIGEVETKLELRLDGIIYLHHLYSEDRLPFPFARYPHTQWRSHKRLSSSTTTSRFVSRSSFVRPSIC